MGKINWDKAKRYNVKTPVDGSTPYDRYAWADGPKRPVSRKKKKRDARKLRKADIEARMSKAGGYSKQTLESLGVPWPPPKGWKQDLINNQPVGTKKRQLAKRKRFSERRRKQKLGALQEQRREWIAKNGEPDLGVLLGEKIADR